MTQFPSYFRADEEIEPDKASPSPNDWFGPTKTKFRNNSTPAFSADEMEDAPGDGWRDFYQGHPRDPMKNKLLPPGSIKFKDVENDQRKLIYVLEQAHEIFEEEGHIDLAAECERLCEMASMEEET